MEGELLKKKKSVLRARLTRMVTFLSSPNFGTASLSELKERSTDSEPMVSCSFLEDPLPSSSDPLIDLPPSQESAEELIFVHMDISSPLLRLRSIVEEKSGRSLVGFRFTLLDSVELNGESSLVEQCMQEKGIVQINCELRIPEKTINIVDFLRPNEDFFYEHHSGDTDEEDEAEETKEVPSKSTDTPDDMMEVPSTTAVTSDDTMEVPSASSDMMEVPSTSIDTSDDLMKVLSTSTDTSEKAVMAPVHGTTLPSLKPGVRIIIERKFMPRQAVPKGQNFLGKPRVTQNVKWTIDKKFMVYQREFGIPQDPEMWNKHVQVWLFWAIGQFKMTLVDLRHWYLTGANLFKFSEDDLNARVHHDSKNLFLTHFRLLRKCRVVAVNIESDVKNAYCPNEENVARCTEKKEEVRIIRMSRRLAKKRKAKTWKPPSISEDDEAIENSSSESTHEEMRGGEADEDEGEQQQLRNRRHIKPPSWTADYDMSAFHAKPGIEGSLKLWKFLLQLLTTWHYRDLIQWTENEGRREEVHVQIRFRPEDSDRLQRSRIGSSGARSRKEELPEGNGCGSTCTSHRRPCG